MPLSAGTKLGSYQIVAPLGAGGMGEVYRAKDTKLNREVAIKVLPEAFAADPDRMARFQREAHVLASLNHPNIAQIYGIEDSALIMELVEGPTLADRIEQGPMPVDEAVPVARQIAEALEYAHDKGIIHRDLKPANVKVTPEGRVKVLDFGLAKALTPDAPAANPATSPTLTMRATMAGVIMGTAGYMSPEQAKGKSADRRADIWAFGVVLAEMMAGHALYSGETVSEILAAVILKDPPIPDGLPPYIRRLLGRCLDRDPQRRLQAIGEARIALENPPIEEPASTATSAAVPRRWMLATGAVVTALAITAFFYTRRPPPTSSAPVTRLIMGLQPAESLLGGPGSNSEARPTRTAIAWSPDGRNLVFGGGHGGVSQLYLRRMDQLQATPLAGTEGAVGPFFSPDGGWVGFWATGELRKVSIGGGPTVTICKSPMFGGATWADGDVIYFDVLATFWGGGISRVAAAGGLPEPVAKPDRLKGEYSYRLPHALPGGKALLFTVIMDAQRWDDAKIVVRSLATGQQMVLTSGSDARYIRTGHLVFARQGDLLAAPFDASALRLMGGPVGVVGDVMHAVNAPGVPLDTGAAQFDVSPAGSLAYASGGVLAEDRRSLVWVDRTGGISPLPLPPRAYWGPRLAPDGQQVAYYTRGNDPRIWVADIRNGKSTPVTERGNVSMVAWTPDGVHITFADAATRNLFWRRADGGGGSERLTTSPNWQTPNSWSPDSKVLAFVEDNSTDRHIFVLPAGERTPPRPWLNSRSSETHADWSRNSRWIAYQSDESGRNEIYVQSYPAPGARFPVSRDGGTSPSWSRDGRELFYEMVGADGQVAMMTVPVTTAQGFSMGAPRKLFEGRFKWSAGSRSYDVTADGRRFVMVQWQELTPRPVSQIVIVENWIEELKRIAPSK